MESLTKAIPFLIRLFALLVGGIVSLVLSGDINLDNKSNAKLTINLKVICKLACARSRAVFGGIYDWIIGTLSIWATMHKRRF
ncbi:hypothetical protein AAX05_03250 [Moraxella bovoculi]|uniref:hypothetical protein n=1 Tax=Moraxella bovoculi TaxID=386891 RepID=UPI0006248DB8|nr:hypothetical protein [Moraxella bovoculi]AKG09352.1 hypothetical protein AAX05_03250 [Moraxella bovoculi]AKG13178.1 hypothetical protein AAX11_03000 [Moraxella bovoculi]